VSRCEDLASADEGDYLQPIAFAELMLGMAGAGNNRQVDLDGDPPCRQVELGQQVGHGGAWRDLLRLAVDEHVHAKGGLLHGNLTTQLILSGRPSETNTPRRGQRRLRTDAQASYNLAVPLNRQQNLSRFAI